MNMFARFNENPAMILQDIKETKRYGRTDAHTDGRTDRQTDNVKTVYPLQTLFAGGITTNFVCGGYKNCFHTGYAATLDEQSMNMGQKSIYITSVFDCQLSPVGLLMANSVFQ